jgi:hypothetical protein
VVRYETCDSCLGSGAKDSSHIKVCTKCGGRGGVVSIQKTPFGTVSQVRLSTLIVCLTLIRDDIFLNLPQMSIWLDLVLNFSSTI